MKSITLATVAALFMIIAACGSDGDDEQTQAPNTEASTSEETESSAETDIDEEAAEPAETSSSGGSTATVTFDDGEVLSTGVICTLEPQEAAGQIILYTASSLSNPYFDVTVFDEDAALPGGTVSWSETEDFQTYEADWSASEQFGDLVLSLDGDTISGTGTFNATPDSPDAGASKVGTLEVNC